MVMEADFNNSWAEVGPTRELELGIIVNSYAAESTSDLN